MKSILKTTIKTLSLSVILLSLAFGLYAQHYFENFLAENKNTAKHKTQTRTTNQTSPKLAVLYSYEYNEDAKKIEEWMLDEDFWNIEYTIYHEPTEEDMEIEEWMKKFDFCISPERISGFVEKDWLKQHSFYIL